MKRTLLTVLFLLVATTVFASTATIHLSYTEPTTNAGAAATPLTDLDHTTIYYDAGAGPATITVPATKLTGGGVITQNIPITFTGEVTVSLWATASDTSGNESVISVKKTVRLDLLAPAAPTTLVILP